MKGRLCLPGVSERLVDGVRAPLRLSVRPRGHDGALVSGFPFPRFLLLCGHPPPTRAGNPPFPRPRRRPQGPAARRTPWDVRAAGRCPCSRASRKEETGLSVPASLEQAALRAHGGCVPTTASAHRAFHAGQTPHLLTSLLPSFQTQEPRGHQSSPLSCRDAVLLETPRLPAQTAWAPVSCLRCGAVGPAPWAGVRGHHEGCSGAPGGSRPSSATQDREWRAVVIPLAPFPMALGDNT